MLGKLQVTFYAFEANPFTVEQFEHTLKRSRRTLLSLFDTPCGTVLGFDKGHQTLEGKGLK